MSDQTLGITELISYLSSFIKKNNTSIPFSSSVGKIIELMKLYLQHPETLGSETSSIVH